MIVELDREPPDRRSARPPARPGRTVGRPNRRTDERPRSGACQEHKPTKVVNIVTMDRRTFVLLTGATSGALIRPPVRPTHSPTGAGWRAGGPAGGGGPGGGPGASPG